jgi:hypothetical protein
MQASTLQEYPIGRRRHQPYRGFWVKKELHSPTEFPILTKDRDYNEKKLSVECYDQVWLSQSKRIVATKKIHL